MDFDLTEDQALFQQYVRTFARDRLADGAHARAHSHAYPWKEAAQLAEAGLMGLTVPESRGGQGAGLMEAVLAIQAVAESCPRSADIVQAGNFGPIRTFVEYAPEHLLDRYLPNLLAGTQVMSLGMTEPQAGSAVTELETSATVDGEELVIKGTKIFSTHSTDASFFLVYVRFGPGLDGIGSVLVERDAPGLKIGRASSFMNGEEWNELHFDNCRIPRSNVVLEAGGFKRQIAGFNVERLGNSARSIAVGRYAYELAKGHAKSRKQFGRYLMEFQGLQWQFADVELALESAQLLLMRAVTRAGDGLPSAHDTALAKLAANQAGFMAANQAVQVMGGLGFSDESLAEYCLRRTRGWQIAGGSTEMLKNRIAEGVFGQRFSQRATKAER